jgi:hypothetical protein
MQLSKMHMQFSMFPPTPTHLPISMLHLCLRPDDHLLVVELQAAHGPRPIRPFANHTPASRWADPVLESGIMTSTAYTCLKSFNIPCFQPDYMTHSLDKTLPGKNLLRFLASRCECTICPSAVTLRRPKIVRFASGSCTSRVWTRSIAHFDRASCPPSPTIVASPLVMFSVETVL